MCSVILETAKRTIPRGSRKKFRPHWSKELQEAVAQRREARKKAEGEPSKENKTNYNRHTAKVRYLSKTTKRTAWKKTCEQLDLRKEGHKAWNLLKNLEGKNRRVNPKPIYHKGETIVDGKKKADVFNDFFSKVNKASRRKALDKAP